MVDSTGYEDEHTRIQDGERKHESARTRDAIELNAEIESGLEEETRPIVDEQAYAQYMAMSKSALAVKKTLQEQLDGVDINLGSTVKHIVNTAERLQIPLKTRQEIIRKKQVFDVYSNKLRTLERKAFGTNIDYQLPRGLAKKVLQEKGPEIITMFGSYHTKHDVLKRIRIDWGYVGFTAKMVENFRKANETEIKKVQELHQRDYSEIRLSHKKSRLQELSEIYFKTKERYELTNSREDLKLGLSTLGQIQKEVDGDKLTIEGTFHHRVEVQLQHHIRDEVLGGLTINDIIIARTATKMGINGRYIMERLRKSMYAQYSGFGESSQQAFEADPQYPSELVYDWGAIESQHKAKEDVDNEMKKELTVQPSEQERTDQLRQLLLSAASRRESNLTHGPDEYDESTDVTDESTEGDKDTETE